MRFWNRTRLLFTAGIITGFVLIAAAVILAYTSESVRVGGELNTDAILAARVAAAQDNECASCHTNHTPGIVNQYLSSAHFQNNTTCADCHEVEANYPGAVQHPEAEFWVLRESSTAMCQTCHLEEVQQFHLSRHALPSYVAYAGSEGLTPEQLAQYQSIPEGGAPSEGRMRLRNVIHQLEGFEFTPFTCESCHDVGAPAADGSVGDCTACHIRHEFSLEQARRPETCNNCHIGPDHPQWEIYVESSHGIAYSTMSDDWNWEAEPGTLTTADFPAPTCATCHFSGFGGSSTTHDAGDRLSWYLAYPLSTARPAAVENRLRMQNVCRACHSDSFIAAFYTAADAATETVNTFVRFSDAIMAPLAENGLLTDAPFDEPIDYVYYELWHHYGRTAKSGVWMQGADYAQWHGMYEILQDLAELVEMANAKLEAADMEPLEMPEGFPGIDAARAYLASVETAEGS